MESNILPIAIKLIKLNIDDEMKAQITLFLANMAGHGAGGYFIPSCASFHSLIEGCIQTLVDGGVLEPIVDLLDTDNDDYQRFSVLAIANMTINIRSAKHRITDVGVY